MAGKNDALDAYLKSLKEDWDGTEEEFASIEAAFRRNQKLSGGVMMQSDYTAKTQEAARIRQEADQKAALADQRLQEMLVWKNESEETINAARREAEEARVYAAKVTERSKTMGLTDDMFQDITGNAPAKKEPAPPAYLERAEFEKTVKDVGFSVPRMAAAISKTMARHQKMFGEPLEDIDRLTDLALNEGKTLTDVYEREYKIADVLKERQEADIQRRINEAAKEAETRVRSEMLNPASPVQRRAHEGPGSPVLATKFKPIAEQPAVNEARGVEKAIQAHYAGTHKGASQ